MADPAADLTGTTVGRFAVRARLGAKSGMGEVYRAEDTKLKRPVALKRMTPELGADERYRQRFLKEAEYACRFSDPHIAGLYDVLEEGGEIFLVMEYVEGETLRQRFARPLSVEQFLKLGVQCAEALVAAHGQGILHRDLKPENIMLTPGEQVKVLDFGVSKRLPRPDETADTAGLGSAPSTGGLSGTPAYMAPETLLEKDADGRADIFSLGVVFYEALTGRHPFLAGGFMATSDRILHEEPVPLTTLNPRAPAELERIVAKMLAKRPEERYQTAADLLVDLRALLPGPLPRRRPPVPPPSLWPKRAWAAGAIAVALATVLLIPAARQWVLCQAGFCPPRVAVAVLPFANQTRIPELDEYRLTFTQFLVHALSDSRNLRVFSYEQLIVIVQPIEKRGEDASSPQAVQAVASFSNSQFVVVPVVHAIGQTLRVEAEFRDGQTGETVGSMKVERRLSGTPQETLYGMLDELAAGIERHFKSFGPGIEEPVHAAGSRPKTATAALYLNDGKNALARGAYGQAVQSFEKALEEDPDYALANAWMGQVYGTLGYDDKALEFSERAAQLISGQTPVVDAYFVQASLAERKFDYATAAQKYLELIGEYPDEALWHASLANVQEKQGDYQQAIAHYQEALARNSNYIVAYQSLSLLYSRVGDAAQAVAHGQMALDRYRALGNREGEAWVLAQLADFLRQKGDLQQATEYAQEALQLFQAVNNDSGVLLATLHLGNIHFARGDFDAARRQWQRVVATSGETRNNRWVALALSNIGVSYSREGNLARAAQQYEQILALPAVRERAVAMANLADIYAEYGPDPERGQQLAQEALEIFQRMGDTTWQAQSRMALGLYYTKVGQYPPALSELQQAEALFRSSGNKERTGQATYNIARAYFSHDQYEPARQAAASALAVFQELEDSFGVANAQIPLGWTYLRLGDTTRAKALLEEALRSAREHEHGELLPFAYNARGELARAAGDPNQARRYFQQASDLWREPHVFEYSIEARSWLGLLEAERGNGARGLGYCRQADERARRLQWLHTRAHTGLNLARVHLLRKEYAPALALLDEIISLDGLGLEFRALAYYTRGQALEGLRRSEEAQVSYRQAREAIQQLQQTLAPEHRESFAKRPDIRPLLP